jgi:hypothetical protein
MLIHFFESGDDDDDELGGAGAGKDWGNLGKKLSYNRNIFIENFASLDGMLKNMGGGMPGGSPTDLQDLEGEDTDSDDEPMPDLEDVPKTETPPTSTK